MNEQINLPEMKSGILMLASELYAEILSYTNMGRVDTKERTGIALSMYVPETRNGIVGQIGFPSDMAVILSVLKSATSHQFGTTSSLNHEDPEKMMFGGSFTIDFLGYDLQCGISGLIGFEDAAISAILLAFVTKQRVSRITMNVSKGKDGKNGKIPTEFYQSSHYISTFLANYEFAFVK